jgi:predicted 2-oxoglutarate/Fe(II)-dependent dioxygenase YbiX
MKSRKIFPGVFAYSDFFDDPMEIFSNVEDMGGWHPAEAGAYGEGPSIVEERRRGLMYNLQRDPNVKKITAMSLEAIKHYKSFYGLNLKNLEGWCLLKYREGDFFSAHTDDSHDFPRQISMVYYANDDYEGGELEFIYFNNLKIKPNAGELLIFPSNYLFVHKVNPITKGEKYAATSFAY